MSGLVVDNLTQQVIPSPRDGVHVEVDLQAALRDSKADDFHHLFDVNLQVFPSITVAAERIMQRTRGARHATSVFTCNVDHLMLLARDESFKDAYRHADVVTIDGAPLALLSRLTGSASARRVTGVDLTIAFCELASREGLRIALVGGAPGHGEQAAQELRKRFAGLPEILVDSPAMGFKLGDHEDQRLLSRLQAFQPAIVVVCLGAPKQELWIDRHRQDLQGAAMIGAGATIDFLSGAKRRAPQFFQRTGTEAFYRLATDFPRLWRRYLLRDSRFLRLFAGLLVQSFASRVRDGRNYVTSSHPWREDQSDKQLCGCQARSLTPRSQKTS